MSGEIIQRFWSKVRKRSRGCWEWTGAMGGPKRSRYGHFKVLGKTMVAHRFAWIARRGEIPDGMIICHHCDNPKCVNPEHLFIGTHSDNAIDSSRKGRRSRHGNHKTFGVIHPHAKLTDSDVRRIRQSPLSSRALGLILKVSHTVILRARRGVGWKHVQ